MIHKISGPPGTGKTTHLLGWVDKTLSKGTRPDDIMFTTFTRAGANEARDRACQKFNLTPQRLPYFRTLHSICFSLINSRDVLGVPDWVNIAKDLGVRFTLSKEDEPGLSRSGTKGDMLIALVNLARMGRRSLREVHDDMDKYFVEAHHVEFAELEHFDATVRQYKEAMGKIDFTDMMEIWLERGHHPMTKYVIVDEAQDMSELQWEVVDKLSEHADTVLVAGDDDQSIYEWNGANPGHLIDLDASHMVLPQSYRIPKSVHHLAEHIISNVSHRLEKPYAPREEEGLVSVVQNDAAIDMSQGTWLLLARNITFLSIFTEHCEAQGYSYVSETSRPFNDRLAKAIEDWKSLLSGKSISTEAAQFLYKLMSQRDRVRRGFKKVLAQRTEESVDLETLKEDYGLAFVGKWYDQFDMAPAHEIVYFKAMEARGELGQEPRIRISTIHGAKGKEADSVAICPDMSWRTNAAFDKNPDQEHRVWYVGVTRARQSLYILQPTRDTFYPHLFDHESSTKADS